MSDLQALEGRVKALESKAENGGCGTFIVYVTLIVLMLVPSTRHAMHETLRLIVQAILAP